jgi:uncharacterized protein
MKAKGCKYWQKYWSGYCFNVIICVIYCLLGINAKAQEKLYPNQFSVSEVQLLPGPFQHARDLNIKVLLQYDLDRLLAGYRKEAGLTVKAERFKNWDGLDGHVAGHYLSAMAMNYAATGNAECKRRMEYIILELKACQEANDKNHPDWAKGYVGAVPNGQKIWSGFKKGEFNAFRAAWVPFYNIHKMYAGLRDAWLYTGNKTAKDLFLQFCDWGIAISSGLTNAQLQTVLDTEHGGMNEVFADAYQITTDKKYLDAARRFSHHMLLDAMAAGKDNLDNKHANTQVPKAIGFARIGELANEKSYTAAGAYFWQTVTTKRSLAFGGNSRREHFPAVASCSDFVDDVEGPETCNTYNMLKLTADLFRIQPSVSYIDYYERALYNHILSSQHPEHGGYVYFTPARPRHYKVYSTPNEAMWCCVGSGMENHSKYNEIIYTHRNDSLYLNLFIPSVLNWKNRKISLRQETKFPYEEISTIKITSGQSVFSLMIRNPFWLRDSGIQVWVNGNPVQFTARQADYFTIRRHWKKGDEIKIRLPMNIRTEAMPNQPEYLAFMYGPILLAAKTGTEDLKGLVADDSRWGHIAGGKRLPLDQAPVIVEDNTSLLPAGIIQLPNKPLHFNFQNLKIVQSIPTELQPFFEVHDTRYMMYWMTLNKKQHKNYLDSLALAEKKKMELEQLTVDQVIPGEQQPEADHFLEQESSGTGNHLDAFWRDAKNGGYFSYKMRTNNETSLSLMIRYWGAEWGSRKFEIYIDDQKLIAEDNTGRWNLSQFRDIIYTIPPEMLTNKTAIRVKFKALPGNIAGAVYSIRLIKQPVQKN